LTAPGGAAQGGEQKKGPHRVAVAAAARAAAVKPATTRVQFKAATKVDEPLRPGAAVTAGLPPFGRRTAAKDVVKKCKPELNVEVRPCMHHQQKRLWALGLSQVVGAWVHA
jgi:hypothetical protein